MNTTITIEAKKEFINWILKNYKMKRRESVWILNYLITHEDLLEQAVFTDDAHFAPRAIELSTSGSDRTPFKFYKAQLISSDPEQGFHDIRLNPNEKIYIQLNYPNNNTCHMYASVQEENEYIPASFRANKDDGKIVDEFLEYMTSSMTRHALLAQIDEALDNGDKMSFMKLTDELKGVAMKREGVLV